MNGLAKLAGYISWALHFDAVVVVAGTVAGVAVKLVMYYHLSGAGSRRRNNRIGFEPVGCHYLKI